MKKNITIITIATLLLIIFMQNTNAEDYKKIHSLFQTNVNIIINSIKYNDKYMILENNNDIYIPLNLLLETVDGGIHIENNNIIITHDIQRVNIKHQEKLNDIIFDVLTNENSIFYTNGLRIMFAKTNDINYYHVLSSSTTQLYNYGYFVYIDYNNNIYKAKTDQKFIIDDSFTGTEIIKIYQTTTSIKYIGFVQNSEVVKIWGIE